MAKEEKKLTPLEEALAAKSIGFAELKVLSANKHLLSEKDLKRLFPVEKKKK